MKKPKVLVLFYSMYGHISLMAEAVAEGARNEGALVDIKRIPETLPEEVLKKMGASAARETMKDFPEAMPEDLQEYDAVIWGVPTRFGGAAAQVRAFLDRTGVLWQKGSLVGKIGSVFTSTATQHGGQETTLISMHISLLHHGNILVGLPYTEKRQMTLAEISGGSPYGASTITGGDGKRMPSANELELARFQGRHVAKIAKKLAEG